MARPRKYDPTQTQDGGGPRIRPRLSPRLAQWIKKQAAAAGVTPAEWLRQYLEQAMEAAEK